jgi:uncharacterized protein YjbI with pentapeptide repeats
LADTDRDAYLASLTPGADVDHRGTPFTEELLVALLGALHAPTAGRRTGSSWFDEAQFLGDAQFGMVQFSEASFHRAQFLGDAVFDGAQFSGFARFDEAQFSGEARFYGARFLGDAAFGGVVFSGEAGFYRAQFSGQAWFHEAQFSDTARFNEMQFSGAAGFNDVQFSGQAWFHEAQFSDRAVFDEAQFGGYAGFGGARFLGDARFREAQFSGPAGFDEAQFGGHAGFDQAQFVEMSLFGPVVCAKDVDLSGAVFEAPVALEIAACEVHCERTRWESTATLRLRYATVDLSDAVWSFPVAVTAHPAPFRSGTTVADESLLAGAEDRVRVVSVKGVDAAHLVLADTDLSDCLFSGAFHLDQLRLAGRCIFAPAPTGLHRRRSIWPYRWTRRRTLAEEHHWRAHTADQPALPPGQESSPRHWRTGPHHPDPGLTPDPEDVAALYRQLRKAFEDGKNEPGAADFYYGEMEMRRHDRTATPPSERVLLWGYWLLSGYGLRASRALGWLVAAVATTVLLIMGLGLPDSSPKQTATGTVPASGGQVTLTVDKQDPRLTLPVADRFTEKRFDKALQVVLNSVVFRASGQDLTTWGTYTEMVSRFTEPVLLALAVLAMRSRIKR